MKKLFPLIICALVVFASASLSAAPIVIKIGSPAPTGSPWDTALKKIASGWKKATDGQVVMKIYPGGIAGDEMDMLRKMRLNSLQGAALTSIGLNNIEKDVMALSVPFLIRNDEEFDYVLEKTGPSLIKKIDEADFHLVTWTMAGWVYFFSKDPLTTPAELKKMKLAAGEGNPANEQAWKVMGYNTLSIHINDVLPALNSGMLEACYVVPLAAAAYQWFGIADNMMDMPISPVLGGIVLSGKTWERIPDKYKDDIIRIANQATEDLYIDTVKLGKDAVEVMLENGLSINTVSMEDQKLWRDEFQNGFNLVVGKSFSNEIFSSIKKELEEYRAAHGN